MASGPIAAWQAEGEKVEVVTDFLFLGSKIIVDDDWSHETIRWLLLGKKVMTNLDHVLKSREITLLTKVHIFKAIVFLVVMYGCESWTVKKAECQRIDAFELWCWRRLLRVPWRVRRSNQSILREINPEYSLEGLMLKLQYFSHPMQWTWTWANSRRWWGTGRPGMLLSMGSQSQTWLADWTTTTSILLGYAFFRLLFPLI